MGKKNWVARGDFEFQPVQPWWDKEFGITQL